MRVLRLHDPARRPPNWTDIIRPGQFAAIAKDLRTGLPCDAEGRPFEPPAAASCLIFDRFDEARTFCEAAVLKYEAVAFDIFDSHGRAKSPLLVVMHPSRALRQDAHPRVLRRRRMIGWGLIAAGVPILAAGYWLNDAGHGIFPGFLGLSAILAGLRLLWFNLALRESEEVRRKRMDAL